MKEGRLEAQWTHFKETERKGKSVFWWAAYIYQDMPKWVEGSKRRYLTLVPLATAIWIPSHDSCDRLHRHLTECTGSYILWTSPERKPILNHPIQNSHHEFIQQFFLIIFNSRWLHISKNCFCCFEFLSLTASIKMAKSLTTIHEWGGLSCQHYTDL